MNGRYILDEQNNPVPCPDLMRWGRFMEGARRVALESRDDVRVSTVFLGLDHSYGLSGGPILYETMVFGGPEDGRQERYRTRDEALAGHAAVCAEVWPTIPEESR